MTFEEFDAVGFSPGMRAEYRGTTYLILSVDFEERLLGLISDSDMGDPERMTWVRCENARIIDALGKAK